MTQSLSLHSYPKLIIMLVVLCSIFSVRAYSQDENIGTDIAKELTQNLESTNANASDTNMNQPNIVTKLSVLVGLSLLPFAIMLLTSFIKMIVVLSLLRNALGVQQTPPNQVLNGIALLLTIYVMFPTCLAMYNSAKDEITKQPPKEMFSGESAVYLINVVDKAKEPLRQFLQKNIITKHQNSFYQMAYRIFPQPYKSELKPNDFIVLIPSFITSQLKAAFEIGVLIYLPFFVIDLVTSNILLAMGMMMLSPLTIALPIKLLLLVMIDGWTILIQGLVLTFK
jgi:type III secretion protein R